VGQLLAVVLQNASAQADARHESAQEGRFIMGSFDPQVDVRLVVCGPSQVRVGSHNFGMMLLDQFNISNRRYSYRSAATMSRRAARRAGSTAAPTPISSPTATASRSPVYGK